jgi:hypothetical protein
MLNSLIGIIASSGGVTSTNSYESIATTTIGSGGATEVTFSSIPSTYTHLQIRFIAKTNINDTRYALWYRFNGDTGANYGFHAVYGDGTGVTAVGYASQGVAEASTDAGNASGNTNVFGAGVVDFLDYAETNKNMTIRSLSGVDNNGSGRISFQSGLWMNTGAVTSITIGNYGNTLMQYSSFALYGIKG